MADPAKPKISRRGLAIRIGVPVLIGWALAPWRRGRAMAGSVTDSMTAAMAAEINTIDSLLLVAGPVGGRLAQWASLLCPLLGPALAAGGTVSWTAVGAADGVTAANQFDAQVPADGNTAMLLPGSAAIAQLVGDPRARFDADSWVAGLAGVTSTVVMGRAPLAQLPTGSPLLVLAGDPAGADLPTLLGLSLLGYNVKPVSPRALAADARTALLQGKIDIATLSEAAVGKVAPWQQSGLAALFTLGSVNQAGGLSPDPSFPTLPQLEDLLLAKGIDPSRPLPTAWRALAAAKQLALGLVLPKLTPASRVAQWRQACAESIASLTIQAIAAAESLRLTTQPTAAAVISALTAPAGAQLELHQWLANRLGWRPS